MIATIKAEWRKSRSRPAFLLSLGAVAAITVAVYGFVWYLALHPGARQSQGVSLLSLYPHELVNNVMNPGLFLGEVMAVVLGALLTGSEYAWGTTKTTLTQGPGRLTNWAGRVVVFGAWMVVMAIVLFTTGAASSLIVASSEGHGIAWPAVQTIFTGLGAVWLVFMANGALGMTLGVLLRHSAAAISVGLVYVLAVELLGVSVIGSLNDGAYKWIAKLFVGQNAGALLQSFTSPAFGPMPAPAIGSGQAVLVLGAYVVGFVVLSAGLLRLRDVT
jgi:ABC-type transport system involved in multi-copper enzyme maturation permease subunit